MKKIILSCVLSTCFLAVSMGQKGVNFLTNGNLRTVFDMAKMQNKKVMLEAYSPTCHICQAFKTTFAQAAVGDLYNKNFISYQLDVNTPEALAFLQKQRIMIPSTPTLLFFDNNVSPIHVAVMTEGGNTAGILLDEANKALDPKKRTASMKNTFLAGKREPSFLVEYAFVARIMRDTSDNIAAMRAYATKISPSEYANNTNFALLQKVVFDDENPMFLYMMQNLSKFQAKFGKALVKQVAENILLSSLYTSRANFYSLSKIQTIKSHFAQLGLSPSDINKRIFREEAAALFKAGKATEAIKVLEKMIDATTNKNGYAYLSNFVRSRTSDKNALAKAAQWAAKAQ